MDLTNDLNAEQTPEAELVAFAAGAASRDAEIAELVAALEEYVVNDTAPIELNAKKQKAEEALAATPDQSLARLKNQVREECAVELDGNWDMAAGIIRAMKEPE